MVAGGLLPLFCDERLDQFSECWEGLDDPRSGNAALHDFHELLPIALCAVLSGGQGAVDMALFAKTKETYLRGFLRLENGPPSQTVTSERLNAIVRQHWEIENCLHWRLDVVMNEDKDRTRIGQGPENLAVLRHMVLNAMQKEGSKGSIRGNIKRARWDDNFLSHLLSLF
jgi:hypothetical protein